MSIALPLTSVRKLMPITHSSSIPIVVLLIVVAMVVEVVAMVGR